MKLLYFAWVREKIGKAEEQVTLPENIITINDLINWLIAKGPEYKAAFAEREIIRTALDQTHTNHETRIGEAKELAFFPPVTGG